MQKLVPLLAVQQQQTDVAAANESNSTSNYSEVPLQMLPYIRFLNEAGQRSLMSQLIQRFQRTSFTPKYAMLATPKFSSGMYLIGNETPRPVGAVDPSLFDKVI